jgi:hypothetical protein
MLVLQDLTFGEDNPSLPYKRPNFETRNWKLETL